MLPKCFLSYCITNHKQHWCYWPFKTFMAFNINFFCPCSKVYNFNNATFTSCNINFLLPFEFLDKQFANRMEFLVQTATQRYHIDRYINVIVGERICVQITSCKHSSIKLKMLFWIVLIWGILPWGYTIYFLRILCLTSSNTKVLLAKSVVDCKSFLDQPRNNEHL